MNAEKRAELIAHSCLIGIRVGHDGLSCLDKDDIAEIQGHIADAILAVQREAMEKCAKIAENRKYDLARATHGIVGREIAEEIHALIEELGKE